jgi:hypothetical protein
MITAVTFNPAFETSYHKIRVAKKPAVSSGNPKNIGYLFAKHGDTFPTTDASSATVFEVRVSDMDIPDHGVVTTVKGIVVGIGQSRWFKTEFFIYFIF